VTSYAKNYQNQPMLHGSIQKIKVARFFKIKTRCTKFQPMSLFKETVLLFWHEIPRIVSPSILYTVSHKNVAPNV